MTRFLMSIAVIIFLFIVSIVVGSYIGYFTGMVYSLTNGWMFGADKEFIASLFGAAGGLIGMIAMAFIWYEAYKEAIFKSSKEGGK
mgnify:CR=1 FL=1